MHHYLKETEFAANGIFEALNLNHKLDHAEVLLNSPHKLAKRFRSDPDCAKAIEALAGQRDGRTIATAILCGALLQIAKQGISKTHGNPYGYGKGIGSNKLPLSSIIANGRNQAMHFEEHDKNKTGQKKHEAMKLEKFFSQIDDDRELNKLLPDVGKRILATEIIKDVLQWKTYDDYLKDMVSLAKS